MAVTGHFIREDKPELVSVTLSCRPFQGSHNAVPLAEHVEEVMREYGIEDTAVALTTDTTADIKCARTKRLPMEWHPCICQVLQRCAQKVFHEKSVKKTLAKHNSLSGHLHHCPASQEKLFKLQQVRGTRLVLNFPVPASSTHDAVRTSV